MTDGGTVFQLVSENKVPCHSFEMTGELSGAEPRGQVPQATPSIRIRSFVSDSTPIISSPVLLLVHVW